MGHAVFSFPSVRRHTGAGLTKMTLESIEQTPRSTELIETARDHFARMRQVLNGLLTRIEDGDAKALAELESCRMQLAKALNNAIEQEAKLEALCTARTGGGAGALDLDAARAEVGRRLACLRAAATGDGVPGGPDG
ncbi:MAG: hypothetical protein JKP98_07065 [Rhodobacteraceae bacterium]|nr:hypothetical protein [Paracoccaceae bacterium]MBL4557000.1 hypothetical protein [Paracoccaceae bacterium]